MNQFPMLAVGFDRKVHFFVLRFFLITLA
jgi:hypothetical protein